MAARAGVSACPATVVGVMVITFASAKARRAFETSSEIQRRFGPVLGRIIERRISELMALVTLGSGFQVPHLHLHQLSSDRDEQFAVGLDRSRRLVFAVAQDPVPRRPDGGIDVDLVVAIELIDVVDYH